MQQVDSDVDNCLKENSPVEFDRCLEGKYASIHYGEMNLKPFKISNIITSFQSFQLIEPEDGAMGFNPFNLNKSLTFNNTDEYQFNLFDKNFVFPTLNIQAVPRTVFRIGRRTTIYQISLQVGFDDLVDKS